MNFNNQEQQQHQHLPSSSQSITTIEKEHMFDKTVTPSDVGKLNRLVIPKQHAEKYFPLDASSDNKGLLLNFEDATGKPWRFRYSYWNSSQSYVITKGWSRFVKDKKLDAGDTVSFHRGVGELGKDRLYIDWRRRVEVLDPFVRFNPSYNDNIRWGRLYPLPEYMPALPRNYGQELVGYGTTMARCYMRPPVGNQGVVTPYMIDSRPVCHQNNNNVNVAAKRLRLFGVNMECSSSSSEQDVSSSSSNVRTPHSEMSIPVLSPLQSRLANSTLLSTLQEHDQHSKKGKFSLSFDIDHFDP